MFFYLFQSFLNWSPNWRFLDFWGIISVIRPLGRCLILTDSLSSIKVMLSRKIAHHTHPLVYECKQLCWSLCQNGIEVKLISRRLGGKLTGRWSGTTGGIGRLHLRDRPLFSSDFQSLARPALMRAGQAKWDSADTGRFAHSIFPHSQNICFPLITIYLNIVYHT
jgi:hypothetical protein